MITRTTETLRESEQALRFRLCRSGNIYYDYYIKDREWYELTEKYAKYFCHHF